MGPARIVLLDTGPLVAFLDRRDRYHPWARDRWGELEPPLITCESVISEACFLLRNIRGGRAAVLDLLSRRVVEVRFRLDEEVPAVAKLMAKYADAGISLADACLVRMSEQRADSAVFTVDRHFGIYRRHSRQVIPTICPP